MRRSKWFLMAIMVFVTAHVPTISTMAANSEEKSWPFTWPEAEIKHYTAYRVSEVPTIDGRLDEQAWRAAPKSPRFVDMVDGTPGLHDTRAAVLWDDTNLYVAFWLEEPFVEATLTERDAPIYQNNDAEIFIAGQDAYYEFEINAYGTIYEVFFIWEQEYDAAGYDDLPEFKREVEGVQPFDGVGFRPHPRGLRIGYFNWDFPGLKSAVHIDGTLNDNSDRDRGWTVEVALPWAGMKPLAMPDGRPLPPKAGDTWRMDFSRFNQYREAAPNGDSGGWFWSSHGVVDSHVPELYPFVHFSTRDVVEIREMEEDAKN